MKKIIAAALISVLAAAFLFGCSDTSSNGDSGAGKQSINVYNWGEYIDPEVISGFEEETGIRVNYTNFATNEELYAKLKSGGAEYDVIFPSDYMISRMINEDMLTPLDFSMIPNFELIDENFKGNDFDPDDEYSVAYAWGTVGIIYNPALLDEGEVVDSFEILWNEKYSGRIVMIDNSRDAMAVALKRLGYSLNTTNKDELDQAYDLLLEQRPLVLTYAMDQTYNLMEGNEAALAVYYAGDAVSMMEINPDLEFVLPKEGSNVFIDSLCIPKNAKNVEGAHAFINYITSTEVTLKNSEVTGYGIPQTEAFSLLDEEVQNDKIMYPPDEILEKCESFTTLPPEILEYYDILWARLKS